MIYLIKQPSYRKGYILLKIGYAEDVDYRFSQYSSHCPESFLISIRSGDPVMENIIHKYFHSLPGIQYIRNEWYLVPEDTYWFYQQEFHRPARLIEKTVWSRITTMSSAPDKVLKYLYDKYGPNDSDFSKKWFLKDRIEQIKVNESCSEEIMEFIKVYGTLSKVSDRLRLLCETEMTEEAKNLIITQLPVTDKAKYFYQAAGPERCKADAYILKRISESIGVKFFNRSELAAEIYKEFQENTKLSLSEIKSKLKDIYQRIGYDKTPKAIDISGFFNISEYTFVDKTTKKRVRGYELIKKLL